MQAARLLAYFLFIVLAGCQTPYENAHDNPRSKPAVGTVLDLHQHILFSRGWSRSYVQHGKAYTFRSINLYEPWCRFYLNEPRKAMKQRRVIDPDQFAVIRSFQRMDTGLYALAEPIQVAANSFMFSGNEDGGDFGPKSMMTIMKLQSTKQPQLVELKCAVYADPVLSNFISVNDIQKTLGDIATLRFKE